MSARSASRFVGLVSVTVAVIAGVVAFQRAPRMAAFLTAAVAFVITDAVARRTPPGREAPPFGARELVLAALSAIVLGIVLLILDPPPG
ncbi:MAG TPA: hypothetical protein VFS05_14125 [Gemmatimonadaceae bacterium]|nr:hypothetical protein [Gemmatimonadaceae bacterium]